MLIVLCHAAREGHVWRLRTVVISLGVGSGKAVKGLVVLGSLAMKTDSVIWTGGLIAVGMEPMVDIICAISWFKCIIWVKGHFV